MRSTLRSFAFGLAGMLATGAMAQFPYMWVISGQVANCYPGQTINVQTIQGTQPTINIDVPVDDQTCSYQTVLYLSSTWAMVQLSTTCNGIVAYAYDSTSFNFVLDTAFSTVNITCGGGMMDCNGVLNGPDMPGAPCDDGNSNTTDDTWTANCICLGDSGMVTDCLGVPGGSALPGTPCTTFLGDPGVWSQNCACIANAPTYDCNGVLNGPDMPGTACDDGNANTTNDTWSANCICVGDSGNFFPYDCNGVLNGPDVPGAPCIIPGTIIEGTWSANCICEENNPIPCQADFWVLQAWEGDSNNLVPIPYELWIWNLSSGGSGVYTYFWDFGDGSSSTDAYPTHTYSDNGPYVLCLTINDGNGCVNTYCDSVSVDEDGIYTGMFSEGNRSDGFTINVQNQTTTGVAEVTATDGITAWPNPVVDELNLALVSDLSGVVNITITDMGGRVVLNEQRNLAGGRNQLRLSTNELGAGLYLVRIGNDVKSVSQRFVKSR